MNLLMTADPAAVSSGLAHHEVWMAKHFVILVEWTG